MVKDAMVVVIAITKRKHLLGKKEIGMEKTFKIEWPDKFGPEWLCLEDLKSCLFPESHITESIQNRVKITELDNGWNGLGIPPNMRMLEDD